MNFQNLIMYKRNITLKIKTINNNRLVFLIKNLIINEL